MAIPKQAQPHAGVNIVKEVTLTYADGTSRGVFCTDEEYNVANSVMIVSRTDTKGFITHGNPDFVEATGDEESDIIAQPHYLLRHPDMPKSAFKDLWETLQSGNIWAGVVKNLRKDGGFYWINAVVKPIYDGDNKIIGYHSVRRKIDRNKAKETQALYDQMRALEE